ncbi:hypothetical protein HDV62DRAFT_397766, partial [Trichoderma sp. SZMC 28011]
LGQLVDDGPLHSFNRHGTQKCPVSECLKRHLFIIQLLLRAGNDSGRLQSCHRLFRRGCHCLSGQTCILRLMGRICQCLLGQTCICLRLIGRTCQCLFGQTCICLRLIGQTCQCLFGQTCICLRLIGRTRRGGGEEILTDRSQAFTSVRAGHCYLLLVGFGRFIDDGPFRSRWSVCWLVIGLPEEVGNLRLGGELGLSFVLTRHLGIMGEVGGKKGKLGTKII